MYLKKSPKQIRQDWQKFLKYNSQGLKLCKHCQEQLKKRLPEFYHAHADEEIINIIKRGQPTFELYVGKNLRVEIVNGDIAFVVDLRTSDVVTVLSPEMDHGIDNLAKLKFCQTKKWSRKRRKYKRKERFII